MTKDQLVLSNDSFQLVLDLSSGIHLASLRNLRTGREYLRDARYARFGNPFTFELLGGNGCYRFLHAPQDFAVESSERAREGSLQTLTVRARCTQAALAVTLRAEVPHEGAASYWHLEVENTGAECLRARIVWPRLAGLSVGDDLATQTAVMPMQIGGIHRMLAALPNSPLIYPYAYVPRPGFTYAAPYALPLIDLLSAYEDEGAFVMVMDPDVHRYTLALTTIGEPHAGLAEIRRDLVLEPGQRVALARSAIGVHVGGWHVAVDVYREWLGGRLEPRDIPSWFREAGALYGVGGIGGGGAYLAFGPGPRGPVKRCGGPLDSEIRSFDELPALLHKARQMGTDVIYLWDYWEGERETGLPPYWNKGDYVPRADLGGPAAFRRGVEAVHRAGGRVLVYVEGFIVWKSSHLGQTHGREMALCDEHGAYFEEYANNWSMCPADEAWQQCLAGICSGLVRDYDVDGVFLDSYGAQVHHTCHNGAHSHWPETDIWNKGLSEIINRVRLAMRQVKPDAVVMTESTSDLLLPVEDGSCDGSLAWGAALNGDRLLGSPLKYAFPAANVFTNGYTLAHINQVFALGANLAVGPAWEEHAEHIRRLVELKRVYKDALIYGRILSPLSSMSPDLVATAFVGDAHTLLAVTNTGQTAVEAQVRLPAELGEGTWQDVLGGGRAAAGQGRMLPVTLRPGELQLWRRS